MKVPKLGDFDVEIFFLLVLVGLKITGVESEQL